MERGERGKTEDVKEEMHLKLIACEVLAREAYICAAGSRHVIDIDLLEKGLHDKPDRLRMELQKQIDETKDGVYDAILLGYGLCSNAVADLRARQIPLVIPRAHDCITLYLGSRARYNTEFSAQPGTFYYTVDYIERNSRTSDWMVLGSAVDTNIDAVYQEYVERYGQDNADYLMEVMGAWSENYSRAAFIDMKVGSFPEYECQTQEQAARRGLNYEKLDGSIALMQAMIEGEWPEKDFLVIEPGQSVVVTYDERIIGVAGGE